MDCLVCKNVGIHTKCQSCVWYDSDEAKSGFEPKIAYGGTERYRNIRRRFINGERIADYEVGFLLDSIHALLGEE